MLQLSKMYRLCKVWNGGYTSKWDHLIFQLNGSHGLIRLGVIIASTFAVLHSVLELMLHTRSIHGNDKLYVELYISLSFYDADRMNSF